MSPSLYDRLPYSPLLAQIVVIRRCNLSCGYCTEYDKTSRPVPVDVLEGRLARLRGLGTLTVSLVGGEPTLHPDLPRLVAACREQGFLRTGLITNGFLLCPDLIDQLNEAGLQEMQMSIDGVFANETTQKVLANLSKRLEWLSRFAHFHVTISAVLGACPPGEALDVLRAARELGFRPRVLLVHDNHGRVHLDSQELRVFRKIVRGLPILSMGLSGYHRRIVRDGSAPFKCRAGSRYLYVDEHGDVAWCSQTRELFSRPLAEYSMQDLRDQFRAYKPCHATCTLGCARFASDLDGWRGQNRPAAVQEPAGEYV